MTRILNMILRHLARSEAGKLKSDQGALTTEQKAAQKRVRKAMKATQRMHRI